MRPVVRGSEETAQRFDVICAGEAMWKVAERRGLRLRPSGGAMSLALELARSGLRVGLATVLPDDAFGRSSRDAVAAAGVDVSGVVLTQRSSGVMLVDASGGTRRNQRAIEREEPLEVPSSWSAGLLLLSGLSPVVSHAAALCKAARAARRNGTLVLIDFDASLHAWAGRDPRTIRMVLREVDAARCSLADLAVLGMDADSVRAAVRPGAVVIVSEPGGGAVATGPFGEVHCAPDPAIPSRGQGLGSAFTSALAASLAERAEPGESAAARWQRALHRGRAAILARSRRDR